MRAALEEQLTVACNPVTTSLTGLQAALAAWASQPSLLPGTVAAGLLVNMPLTGLGVAAANHLCELAGALPSKRARAQAAVCAARVSAALRIQAAVLAGGDGGAHTLNKGEVDAITAGFADRDPKQWPQAAQTLVRLTGLSERMEPIFVTARTVLKLGEPYVLLSSPITLALALG